MKNLKSTSSFRCRAALAAVLLGIGAASPALAANHREAPLTAIDVKADITDWFAFVSYNDPSKVTMIMNVDPLLSPSNGPNYFPFDSEILSLLSGQKLNKINWLDWGSGSAS